MSARPSSRVPGGRDVREAGVVQRAHQEVAGTVAGEHAAGPVAAVRGRREADDQQPGGRVAEAGHRAAPVGLVAVVRASSRAPPPRSSGAAAGHRSQAITACGDLRR